MMKKTRNYIRIVALLLVVVTFFTLPVSADSVGPSFIDLMDYGTANDSGVNYVEFTGSTSVKYNLPDAMNYGYVDALVYSTSPISSVTTNGSKAMSLVNVFGPYYRIYGSLVGYLGAGLVFNITSSSTAVSRVDFKYVRFSSMQSNSTVVPANLTLSGYQNSSTASFSADLASLSLPNLYQTYSDAERENVTLNISIPTWYEYDYIDVGFINYGWSTASLNCCIGDEFVPFELSYLNSDSTDALVFDYQGQSDVIQIPDYTQVENVSNIQVRIDLTGVRRNQNISLVLVVNGLCYPFYGCSTTIYGCDGYIEDETISSTDFWLRAILNQEQLNYKQLLNIRDFVSSGFSALQSSMVSWLKTINDSQFDSIEVQESIKTEMISGFDDISSDIYSMRVFLGNKISDLQLALDGWFQFLNDKIQFNFDELFILLNDKFKAVTDRLDKLIGGTTEGDELSQGAADLEEQVGDIHDFEQSQQSVLDNNLPAIQESVSLTGFTGSLAFVQRYLNGIFLGIGDFKIIFAMPIVIGIFFFICNRIPGATRFGSSRAPRRGRR